MKKLLLTLSAFLFLCPPGMSAQILTRASHSPLTSDSLLVYKMAYVAPPDTGKNCIWDFSNLSTDSAETIDVEYYATNQEDSTYFGLHREHTNYYYHIIKDTLWQTGYETSRALMNYAPQVPLLRYPFACKDSLHKVFVGDGKLCRKGSMSVDGTISVKADATGYLILPEDTIYPALRVRTLIEYSETKHLQNRVREERFAWYSPYCRYPMIESVLTQTLTDTTTVSFASTYYYPQEQDEELRKQYMEEEEIVEDSLVSNIQITPNPVYDNVQIGYTLARPAQVYISLHYNGGLTTYQSSPHQEEEGDHSVYVNMSGMPVGSYVVYIHADDVIANGSLIKL